MGSDVRGKAAALTLILFYRSDCMSVNWLLNNDEFLLGNRRRKQGRGQTKTGRNDTKPTSARSAAPATQ